ncbi:MAG TPA: bifunctional 4-hydroxy-2-oxoglutarate aldolase/2-dehydro-3-deoxy-phosphogluconate aldolase [Rhodothermales bacterium]|nr:bifunctional 4-hydroxy-2-oxoglutarate aldolase/2-dehydro-3-deoxy-phosphogluconate aldolase [Rhodothermales bacterium]
MPLATGARTLTRKRIEDEGAVAVVRLSDGAALGRTVEALVAGGVRAIEVTMTVPGAVEHIRALARDAEGDVLVGAGTVLDPDTAQAVIDAGARFVVSPAFDAEVVARCHAAEVAALPGAYTPTEILRAWTAGADVVKVFPATALGPRYLRDVRGPLPDVRLMPTGGVTVENVGEWIAAGAVAVGLGTDLVDSRRIAAGDFPGLTERARRLVENIRAARAALTA